MADPRRALIPPPTHLRGKVVLATSAIPDEAGRLDRQIPQWMAIYADNPSTFTVCAVVWNGAYLISDATDGFGIYEAAWNEFAGRVEARLAAVRPATIRRLQGEPPQ